MTVSLTTDDFKKYLENSGNKIFYLDL